METRATFLGHPVHQMLIVLPLGLLSTAVIFDIIYLVSDSSAFAEAAWLMIAAGVLGGLIAALFGFIDFLGIPAGTRARRIGRIHGIGNVIVLALFALSFYFRLADPSQPAGVAMVFSFLGFALAGVTGWLGGELVSRLGVGVYDGANLDAPSSLSGKRGT